MATNATSSVARKYSTREERSRAVESWRHSGLTKGQFAAREGIPPATFSRWVRATELRPKADTSALLVPVRIEPTARHASSDLFEVVLPGGIELRVPARFDRGSLRDLLMELAACSR